MKLQNKFDLLKTLGVKKKYISLLVHRTPFETMRNLLNALFLKYAFDSIQCANFKQLCVVCAVTFFANFLLFSYNCSIWRVFGAFYADMQAKLRVFLLNRLLHKPIEQIDSLSSGDVLLRLNSDTENAAAIYGEPWNIVFLANGLFNFIFSSLLMILLSGKLFVLVIAFVIPHVLLSCYVLAPAQFKIQKKVQNVSAELTDMYASFVNTADLSQLYDCKDFLLQKIECKNNELRRLNVKKSFVNAVSNAVMPLFGLSGYLVLMLTGADMISAGIISYGTLLYACQLRGGILPAAMMIIKSYTNICVNNVSLNRIEEL